MQKNLKFLRISSTVIKITGWIFLCLGVIGGISIILGLVPFYPRWVGIIYLIVYLFFFLFFLFIAKMGDLLIWIIKEKR